MTALPDWPPGSLELLVQLANGDAHGGTLVDWAVNAVESGCDSPSLLRLAAFTGEAMPLLTDATALFDQAVHELGLTRPADDQALLLWLEQRAAAIAAGEPNLDAALEEIHDKVVTPLNHRDDVGEWCYLYERLALGGRDEPLTDDEIRDAARQWLDARRAT